MAQEAISLIKEVETLAARNVAEAEQKARDMLAEAKSKASEFIEECKRAANEEAKKISEKAKADYDEYIVSYLKKNEYSITELQSKADERIDNSVSEIVQLLF